MLKFPWKWILTGLLVLLFAYFLWPLNTDHWDIERSKSRQEVKDAWLDQSTAGTPGTSKINSERPNIVLIMADDLGWADMQLYDENGQSMPHLEQLASEGVKFNHAYVTSPVCSPSRAAILTGRYTQRFGFEYQLHNRYLKNRLEYHAFKLMMKSGPWKPRWMASVPGEEAILKQGLPPDEITLSEVLQKNAYRTGLIGKWHLGWNEDNKPCDFGFDYQFGFYESHSLYAYEGTPGIIDQKVPEDFTDKHIWKGQRDGPHAIYRNCKEIDEPVYLTDRIAEEGIDFINRNREAPFFLLLSFNAPHTPLQAKEDYYKLFAHIQDPVKRIYAAMIANLDDAIGSVLAHIKEESLEENTLIFFISDNGGAEYTFTTENGSYRGGKITDFEGGVKVPFIMKWKGQIPEGETYSPMVSSMDIFQTTISVAGSLLPEDRKYDGVNLLPYLKGDSTGYPHDMLFWQRGFSKALRTNDWKVLLNEDAGDTLLYDLAQDPYENEDVMEAQSSVAGELLDKHALWSSELADPLWPSMVHYQYRDGDKVHYFDQ